MADDLAQRIAVWATGRYTGISSKGLARATIGVLPDHADCYPRDSDDLGRCVRLIENIPEARSVGLKNLAAWSAIWARLSEEWDMLTAGCKAEKHKTVSDRMDALINPQGLRSWRYVRGDNGLWDIAPCKDDETPSNVRLGKGITLSFRGPAFSTQMKDENSCTTTHKS